MFDHRRPGAFASGALLGAVLGFVPSGARAAAVVSAQSGEWSLQSTWSGGSVPTAADSVAIAGGHTVTVDITTATASTTTVSGTLSFSRTTDSLFVMVEGSMTVLAGGFLDIGTEASPIPGGTTAQLVLALGGVDGEYGLAVRPGAKFSLVGAETSPFAFAQQDITTAVTTMLVAASSATGWAVGDRIAIGPTQGSGPGAVEERVITSLAGTDPVTVGFDSVLAAGRTISLFVDIPVVNLSRNAVVRSSDSGKNFSSFVENQATSTADFKAVYGAFAGLGTNTPGKRGVSFTAAGARGSISSSTVEGGFMGVELDDADLSVFTRSIFFANEDTGLYIAGASSLTVAGNHALKNGRHGIAFDDAGHILASTNAVYANAFAGIECLNSTRLRFDLTAAFSNDTQGLHLTNCEDSVAAGGSFYNNNNEGARFDAGSTRILIERANLFTNGTSGFECNTSDRVVVSESTAAYNSSHGFRLTGCDDSTLESSRAFGHSSGEGFSVFNSQGVLLSRPVSTQNGNGLGVYQRPVKVVGGALYANSSNGLFLEDVTGVELIRSELGFNNFQSSPNQTAELNFEPVADGDPEGAVFKECAINASPGIPQQIFAQAGGHAISYNKNLASGTVIVQGDYTVAGTTWTLDFAADLYASTATPPRALLGTSILSVALNAVYDAEAVSELVQAVFRSSDSKWHVVGSSTGDMGTFPPAGGTADFPAAGPRFNLTLSAADAVEGDRADFAVSAAAGDAGVQKSLLFAPADPAFNMGRSRLVSAPGAGLRFLSQNGSPPTLIRRLNGSATYFTLISSGAFTAVRSSFTDLDSEGLQLTGSGGVLIASTTFDMMGLGASTNSYITARDLASSATFYGLVFETSRDPSEAPFAYNILVAGDDSGLDWTLRRWAGPWGGAPKDFDPGNRVEWSPFPPGPGSPLLAEVHPASATLQWTSGNNDEAASFLIEASTDPAFSGQVISSNTFNLGDSVTGLTPNTTYHIRLAAVDFATSPFLDAGSTITKAAVPSVAAPPFPEVRVSSIVAIWGHNGNPLDRTTYTVALSTGSDYPDNSYSGNVSFSTLPQGGFPQAVFTGLAPNTTYFAFARGVDHGGTFTGFAALGSTVTLTYPPASAASTFTAVSVASITLRWEANGNAVDVTTYAVVATTKPVFPNDAAGNVLLSTAPQGASPQARLTGLASNTTYFLFVESLNHAGAGSGFIPLGSTTTRPAVPSGAPSTFTAVEITSMTIRWDPSGNALDITTYPVALSTSPVFPVAYSGNVQLSTAPQGASPQATMTGLTPNTTYYLHASAEGHDGSQTLYTNLGSTATRTFAPLAASPSILDVGVSSISAAWDPNGNPLDLTTYTAVLTTGTIYPNSFSGNSLVSTAPAGAPQAVFTGLSINTVYSLFVRSVDHGGGASEFTPIDSTSTFTLTPAAAATPFAAVHASSAVVSWNANGNLVDVTSYTAAMSLIPQYVPGGQNNVEITTAPQGASPQAVVSGLTGNTTYFFLTAAVNHDGIPSEFVLSGATVTLANAPAAAPVPFSSVSTASAGVSWSVNGNAVDFTTFTIVLTSGAAYPNAHSGNAQVSGAFAGSFPTTTMTGLAPNTTYSLFGEALSHSGIKTGFVFLGSTVTLAADPLAAAPPFPQVGAASLSVSWDAGGNPLGVTTYTALVAGVPGNVETTTLPVSLPIQATLGGLSVNTTYTLFVEAFNHAGRTTGFKLLGTTSTLALPAAVSAPPFYAVHPASLSVHWGANGNPQDETNYFALLSTGSSYPNAFSGNVTMTTAPAGPDLQATLSGLAANTTYHLFVESRNHSGAGAGFTAMGSTSTLAALPASAASTFTAVWPSSAAAAWDRNGNAVDLTTYTLVMSTLPAYPNAASGSVIFSTAPAGPDSGAVIPGLASNTTYYLFAAAANHNGVPSPYAALGSTVTPPALPGFAPETFTAVSTGTIAAAWDTAGNPLAVTTYSVVLTTSAAYPNGDSGNVALSTVPAASPASAAAGGLTANTTYYLFVSAIGHSRDSGYALLGATVTLGPSPAAAAETFLSVHVSSMDAAWEANGNPVGLTTYSVVATTSPSFPNSDAGNASISTAPSGASPTGSIAGLLPNTTYYLFAASLNHAGTPSAFAALGSTPTRADAVGAAGAPETAVSSFSATVSWDRGANPVDITTYTVLFSTGAPLPGSFPGDVSLSTAPPGAEPVATISGLSPNTTYYWYTGAVNHAGIPGPVDLLGTRTTLAVVPAAAAGAFAQRSPLSIQVLWDANGNPAGETLYDAVATTGAVFPNAFTGNAALSTRPAGSAPSAVLSGLAPNTTYYFHARAVGHQGDLTAYAALGSTTTLAAAPASAASTFSAVGLSSVTAAWSPNGNPPGETPYEVVLTSGSSYPNSFTGNASLTTVPAGAFPEATLSGLAPNTTHYLFAAAIGRDGLPSPFSPLGSTVTLAAVPTGAPSTFTSITVGSMIVRWGANGNPSAATLYEVVLTTGPAYPNSHSGNASYALSPAGDPAQVVAVDLAANTTYSLFVQAVNHAGVPTGFVFRGSTATLALPAASAASTFTAVGISSITAAWSANGNPPSITNYTLVFTTGASYPNAFSGNAAFSTTPAGGSPQATATGLGANSTYFLFVEAVNHNGLPSGFVSLGSTSTLAAPPAPADPAFTAIGTAAMTVHWSGNGNAVDATTYTAVLSTGPSYPNSFSGNASLSTAPAGPAPSADLSGLAPNTTYHLFVEALDHAGRATGFSAAGSTPTLAAVPAADGVPIRSISTGSVQFAWSANGNPVGLTTYTVVLTTGASYPNSHSGNLSFSTAPAPTTPAAAIGALAGNTTYFLFVEAVNHAGAGSGFGPPASTATAADLPVPAGPAVVTASSVLAAWGNSGNSPETAYTAQVSTDDFASVNAEAVVVGTGTLFAGLDGGTTYYFRVRAEGHNGASTAFTTLPSTVTLSSTPGAAAVPFSTVGTSSLTAHWTDAGNPAGTEYRAEISTDAFATINLTSATYGVSALFGLGGAGPDLSTNTVYSLRVQSAGPGGPGPYLTIGSTSTLTASPGVDAAPIRLTSTGTIHCAWDANGNPVAATTYTVVLSTSSSYPNADAGTVSLATAPAGTEPSASVGGLTPNTTYALFVSALNHDGIPSSFIAMAATATLAAPASGASFASVGASGMSLSWDSGGNPIGRTTYTVVLTTGASFPNGFSGNVSASTLTPAAVLAGLSANTTYSLFVEAVNHAGTTTGFAALGSTATLAAAPATAVSTFSEVGSGDAQLFWSANGNPAGITTYTVAMSTDPSFPNSHSGTVLLTTAPAGLSPQGFVSGLVPNTTYYLAVGAVNHGGEATAATPLGSTVTLAAVPGSAVSTFTAVNTQSMSVSWDASGNPPSQTTYSVLLATAASPVPGDPGTVSLDTAPSGGTPSALLGGLISNTTYYLFVRALNRAGTPTSYAVLGASVTRAATPASAAASFPQVGSSSVTAAWDRNGNPVGRTTFTVVLTTGTSYPNAFSGNILVSTLPPGASPQAPLTGLAANTTYTLFAAAVDHGGTPSPYANLGSTLTRAAPPLAADPLEVSPSSVTAAWGANGNAPGTIYAAEVSTDAFGTVSASSATLGLTADFTGLAANTTYYFRVKATAFDGSETPYTTLPSTVTPSLPPAPAAESFPTVRLSSITVQWDSGGNGAATRYDAQLSTDAFATVNETSTTFALSVLFGAGGAGPALAANTTFYFQVRSIGPGGPGLFVSLGSTPSWAAAPAAESFIAVSSFSAELDWSPGGNPEPGTLYEVWRDLSDSFPAPVAASTAGTRLLASGLAADTTHYFKVRAVNHAGIPSPFGAAAATRTFQAPPGAPGVPAGTALGVSSISWSWSAAPRADGYAVVQATSPATVIASTGTAAFVHEGLSTNTAYGVAAAGANNSGLGALSAAATVYTLAMPPSGTAAAAVWAASATVSWSLNTNPAATAMEVDRSTDNAAFSTVFSSDAVAFTDENLLGCTTYYYRVRNLNGDSIPTAYDSVLQFRTMDSTPLPSGSLTAESLSGNRIGLNWSPSPSAQVAGYSLYSDSGTGTMDYGTPVAVFTATETAYTTAVLGSSPSYKFGLRTLNACGIEEKNDSLTASAGAAPTPPNSRAAITIPATGKRVTGNSLTVAAGLVEGTPSQTKEVLFQYRHSTGSAWMDIPAVDAEHPNPDAAYPYFIHWNTLALAATSYDLRAVAADASSTADPAPPTVTIVVDAALPDISESAAGGKIEKVQAVYKSVENTVESGDGSTAQSARVVLPAGALDASTTTVKVISNPAPPAGPPSGISAAGVIAEISITDGQTQLPAGKTAAVTLSYPDSNGDGIVDGTQIRARDLVMYAHPGGAGSWSKDFASSVDLVNRTVAGQTPHFSFFALFAPVSGGVSSVRVYPVPFKPNSGNPDDGAPYSAGDLNSGIIFDLLPDGTTIKIYTITGQLVDELDGGAAGRAQWDARTRGGHDAASGGYLAVIKSPGESAVVRKLLIIR